MARDDLAGARRATGSAALIRDSSGRILLLRRAYPPYDWVLPGGNAEAGEGPVATVVREVEEETGWRVAPQRLTGVYHQPDHGAGQFLHFVFECPPGDGPPILPAGEIAASGWFGGDELPEAMSLSTRRRLLDALAPQPPLLPVELDRDADGS